MNLYNILSDNPIIPNWLERRNIAKGKLKVIKLFSGDVIETGCGAEPNKETALRINKKIKSYTATDTSEWDEEFKIHAKSSQMLGFITELLYGKPKDLQRVDKVCDALKLPFKNESFNTYCCFGVLEHISDPQKFFKEAHRVLRIKGHIYLSIPFMYREHGTVEKDYQRITRGGFMNLAKTYGFKIDFIYANSFYGSMMASFINQYIIRKIVEGHLIVKIVLFPLSPFIFLFTNVTGYFIDKIDHDYRFSPVYFVAMTKIK